MDQTARAWQILETAELIHSAAAVDAAIERVAAEIAATLKDRYPLVLSVMGGAVVFTGRILPLLKFPLDFDYIHASRYGVATSGGPVDWKVEPKGNVAGRVVLVLDDILDIGDTMLAIRQRILGLGAEAFYSAVLTDKQKGHAKPIYADFVGLSLPDRYVFGCGMDAHGIWRNLPAIYALKE
jgi:hypoxanthine phosphoribosyltransferase